MQDWHSARALHSAPFFTGPLSGSGCPTVHATTLCGPSAVVREKLHLSCSVLCRCHVDAPRFDHREQVFISQPGGVFLDACFLLLRFLDVFAQTLGPRAGLPPFFEEALEVLDHGVFACYWLFCVRLAFRFIARVITPGCELSVGTSVCGGSAGGGSGGSGMFFKSSCSNDFARCIFTAVGALHCGPWAWDELDALAAAGRDDLLMLRVRELIGGGRVPCCGESSACACTPNGFMSCTYGMQKPVPPKYAMSAAVGRVLPKTRGASERSACWMALFSPDWSSESPTSGNECSQSVLLNTVATVVRSTRNQSAGVRTAALALNRPL